jgi:hypothetical protein
LSFSISFDKWLQFSLWDDETIFGFIGTYTILLACSLLKIDFSLGFGAEITTSFSGSVGSPVALFRCWDFVGAGKTC